MGDGWPTYVDDVLALAELTGRGTPARLGLWACDTARRGCHELLTGVPDEAAFRAPRAARAWRGASYRTGAPSPTHDPRFRRALAELSQHFAGRPAKLELARQLASANDPHESRSHRQAIDLISMTLGCALGGVAAGEVAAQARQAMLPEQGDWAPVREFEARWQARRLLWRTGLMPRLADMLVRLDLAEHAGAVPRDPAAHARFDDLRARIHAEEDARLDLIFEFGEALYLTELELG